MSDSSSSEELVLEDLIASRQGLRGWFTRAQRSLNALIQTQAGPPANTSQVMYDKLLAASANLDKRYEALTENLQNIAIVDEDATHNDENQRAITDTEGVYNEINTRYLTTIASFNINVGPAPVHAGAHAPNQLKPVQDLKPFQLNFENTPSELNDWMARFRSYMLTSNLNLCPIPQQQAFFRQNVTSAIWIVLKQDVNDHTQVFSDSADDVTCFSLLQDLFTTRYPLIMRRFEFFKFVQAKDMPYSEFYGRLRELSNAALLEEMTAQDFLIYRIITGVNEAQLRNKILAIPADKFGLQEVDRICRTQESAANYSKLREGNSAAATAKMHSGKSKQKQKQNKHGRNFNSGKNNYIPPKLNWLKKSSLCTRCAKPKHKEGQTCPHVNATCHSCQKEGHISTACFGTPIPGTSKKTTHSRQNSRVSSPTPSTSSNVETHFAPSI